MHQIVACLFLCIKNLIENNTLKKKLNVLLVKDIRELLRLKEKEDLRYRN